MAKRIDNGTLGKPVTLGNGWLQLDAYLTRTGIFLYRDSAGTERREYRPDSEVFAPESIATYTLAPVTDDHPADMLTADNTRAHMRGATLEARKDGKKVFGRVQVMDSELIEKIKNGKREVSCGYECDLDESPGEINGERYDAIQRNIRINHVAIVDMGRAGPDVRVRIDSASAMVAEIETERKGPPMKKFTKDGVEYEMTEQAAQLLESFQSRLDAKEKELSTLRAQFDAITEKLATSEQARKDAEDPSRLAQYVAARTQLEQAARLIVGAEVKLDGLSDEEVMRAAVAKANPKLDLTGKDGSYLQARFDGYVEDAKGEKPAFLKKKIEEEDEEEDEDEESVREDSVSRTDAQSAREKMLAYNASLCERK